MAKCTTGPTRPPPPPPPPPRPSQQVLTTIVRPTMTVDTELIMPIKSPSSLSAAADLIRTLDSAFAEMSSLSTEAARDAEDARRNARAASEVARRYASRSYPKASVPSPSAKDSDWENWTPTSSSGGNHVSTPGSGRKRKIMKTPSATERLAQSHAEDVLSLSLELERTKQELENERMSHDMTRSSLAEQKTKNTQLEGQIQKVLSDMEFAREEHARKMDGMSEDLGRAQYRAETAEEDAQLALDLARGNAESREQLEVWLQRALQEVQTLRDQLNCIGVSPGAVLPKKKNHHVHFAESPTFVSVPNRHDVTTEASPPQPPPPPPLPKSPRSMVAAGRQLLQKVQVPSTPLPVHTIALTPSKSAERRHKLRERLRAVGEELSPSLLTPAKTSPAVHGIDMGMATQAIATCTNVATMIRESGLRLGLAGHWWTLNKQDQNVEAMTRYYCNSIETKIDSQKEEIKELESFCGYLEGRVCANGSDVPTLTK